MEFEFISRWAGLVSVILSIVTVAWTLVSRSTKPFDDRLGKTEVKQIEHDRRIQAIESELKHLPSKTDITELKLAIAKLDGHFEKLENSVETMKFQVNRIDRAMLESAK